MIEIHTYKDGSQRVGCPPFPKLSPIQEAQRKKEPDDDVGVLEVAIPTPPPDVPEQAEPDTAPKRKPGRPKKAD